MNRSLIHRGPDDSDLWTDPVHPLSLGHRRLAIIDVSPDGRQPMHSRCGRFHIVFNGELYNYLQIRDELRKQGISFHTASDTEVLLAALTAWGIQEALPRMNGMFAFALWDRERRVLTLARDRFGEKPVYYGWVAGRFSFASELKALRAHPGLKLEISRDALRLYLRHGYVPAPASIYSGVYKLPPGTYLTVDGADRTECTSPVSFCSAQIMVRQGCERPFSGSPDEAVTQLKELLEDAVRLRMQSDVPVGAFLSGGMDSSLVTALMQQHSRKPVKTFTIGFSESTHDEAAAAERIAGHLGTDHTTHYVTPREAQDVIPLLADIYDEPFADSSQIPTYLVSKLARTAVTVTLSGDGGDELFGGYDRYAWGCTLWSQLSKLPYAGRTMIAKALLLLPERFWRAMDRALPLRVQRQRLPERTTKLADVLLARTPSDLHLRLISHVTDPGALLSEPSGTSAPWFSDWDLGDPRLTLMSLDLMTYLPDDILTKLDRASMATSLEARVPLLDPRVVEFAWTLPLEIRMREGRGKWPIRSILTTLLPAEIMPERAKMGFTVPIGQWLRGPLLGWAHALLDPARIRAEGLLDVRSVTKIWQEHLSGKRNWQQALWTILMLQSWSERWGR